MPKQRSEKKPSLAEAHEAVLRQAAKDPMKLAFEALAKRGAAVGLKESDLTSLFLAVEKQFYRSASPMPSLDPGNLGSYRLLVFHTKDAWNKASKERGPNDQHMTILRMVIEKLDLFDEPPPDVVSPADWSDLLRFVFISSAENREHAEAYWADHVTKSAEQLAAERWFRETARPTVAKAAKTGRIISNLLIAPPQPKHFMLLEPRLARLRAFYESKKRPNAGLALHGPPGVGKTALAVAYTDRYAEQYDVIWFLKSGNEAALEVQLISLAIQLGFNLALSDPSIALLESLPIISSTKFRVLLIFDGALNVGSLQKFLPTGRIDILITSNSPRWRPVAHEIELEPWADEIGAEYLCLQAGQSDAAAARSLSKVLEGLPIALEQAAAYCRQWPCTFKAYEEAITSYPLMLNSDAYAPEHYHGGKGVAHTVDMAVLAVADANPRAAFLVTYAAVLQDDWIPVSFFSLCGLGIFAEEIQRRTEIYDPDNVSHTDLGFFVKVPVKGPIKKKRRASLDSPTLGEERVTKIVHALQDFALVTVSEDQKWIKLNRLVREVCCARLGPGFQPVVEAILIEEMVHFCQTALGGNEEVLSCIEQFFPHAYYLADGDADGGVRQFLSWHLQQCQELIIARANEAWEIENS